VDCFLSPQNIATSGTVSGIFISLTLIRTVDGYRYLSGRGCTFIAAIFQAQSQYVVQQTMGVVMGSQPSSGYPSAPHPTAGYPSAPHPSAGYPSAPNSSAGYPSAPPASAYPSLEMGSAPGVDVTGAAYPGLDAAGGTAYPGLAEYMGMELSRDIIAANMPEYLPENQVSHFTLPV
jgi:hypothetical protein